MSPSTFTNAQPFKAAFFAQATALLGGDVLVAYGDPGDDALANWPDAVCIYGCKAMRDWATFPRSFDETLTLTVLINVQRDTDAECEERAYELLGQLDYMTRVSDITVGGTVRDCTVSGHESPGVTSNNITKSGRLIELGATFTAHARITGS